MKFCRVMPRHTSRKVLMCFFNSSWLGHFLRGVTSTMFTTLDLLLMAEIRRSPVEVGSLSHYLYSLIHPRWCRISSINSMCIAKVFVGKKFPHIFLRLKGPQRKFGDHVTTKCTCEMHGIGGGILVSRYGHSCQDFKLLAGTIPSLQLYRTNEFRGKESVCPKLQTQICICVLLLWEGSFHIYTKKTTLTPEKVPDPQYHSRKIPKKKTPIESYLLGGTPFHQRVRNQLSWACFSTQKIPTSKAFFSEVRSISRPASGDKQNGVT